MQFLQFRNGVGEEFVSVLDQDFSGGRVTKTAETTREANKTCMIGTLDVSEILAKLGIQQYLLGLDREFLLQWLVLQ